MATPAGEAPAATESPTGRDGARAGPKGRTTNHHPPETQGLGRKYNSSRRG